MCLQHKEYRCSSCDGAQVWPRGATPGLRPGAAAERSYPTSKERLGGATPHPRSGAAAQRSYPTPKLRD